MIPSRDSSLLHAARRPLLILLALIAAALLFLRVEHHFSSLPAENLPAPQAAKQSQAEPASGIAAGPSREIVNKEGVNAGDFYLRAITLLGALSEDEKNRLKKVTERLNSEDDAKLFEKIQPIMELLRQAAAADHCDWGIDRTLFDPWPWSSVLEQGSALGRLALWNAAYRFPSDASGAISDLSARAALGRNLCETVIGLLVTTHIQRTAADLIRQNAGLLDESTVNQARQFIESTLTNSDVAKAYRTEAEFAATVLDNLAASEKTRNDWVEQNTSNPKLSKILSDPALLKSEIDYLKSIQQQRVAFVVLPEAQYLAWETQIASTFKDHPLAAFAGADSFSTFRASLQKARIENAMVSAGMTVMLNGPEQLAAFRDPSSGALFTYIAQPAGFELRSAYIQNGKSVTMQFAKQP